MLADFVLFRSILVSFANHCEEKIKVHCQALNYKMTEYYFWNLIVKLSGFKCRTQVALNFLKAKTVHSSTPFLHLSKALCSSQPNNESIV